ncbi:small integral membrane protein 35 [Microcaecilia unicolor]|uniref:Small integral membrane protein 35 n=1 Tax=Microcaecilia unicolor TaxID=1415580 RepID=A0A6P7ZUZ5_9AMPH|nr:small integral membrane protein 35 [Microcaecilia unicolor]
MRRSTVRGLLQVNAGEYTGESGAVGAGYGEVYPRDMQFAAGPGAGMASALGLILGVSLAAMLICVVSYVLIKWHQGGWCRQSSNFIFNLDKFRHPKSVELELAPPFTISGNTSTSGYVQFHDCNM